MKQRLRNLGIAASIVLLVLTIALWVIGMMGTGFHGWFPGAGKEHIEFYGFSSHLWLGYLHGLETPVAELENKDALLETWTLAKHQRRLFHHLNFVSGSHGRGSYCAIVLPYWFLTLFFSIAPAWRRRRVYLERQKKQIESES